MPRQTWFPPLASWWDPRQADVGTEPYVRFLIHRTGELLHADTSAPWSLPIVSTAYLLAHSRREEWCRGRKNLADHTHRLEGLWQDLKLRLAQGAWIEELWPQDTKALRDTLYRCVPTSSSWIGNNKPWQKPNVVQNDVTQLAYNSPRKRGERDHIAYLESCADEIYNAIQQLHGHNVLPKSHTEQLKPEALHGQMDAIAKVIQGKKKATHEQKLRLLDNYITDVIRDLLHYGHSAEYLYNVWFIGEVVKRNDGRTYVDRFTDLKNSSLIQGNKSFTVLHRVGHLEGKLLFRLWKDRAIINSISSELNRERYHPELADELRTQIGLQSSESSISQIGEKRWLICDNDHHYYTVRQHEHALEIYDTGKIGTFDMQFLPNIPPEYKSYRNFQNARHIYEHQRQGPDNIDECSWITQQIEAKDNIAAAREASRRALQYRATLVHLTVPRRESEAYFNVGRDPLVIDNETETIYATLLQRDPDTTSMLNAERMYDLRDQWETSGQSYKEETIHYLETIFEWLIQSERFRLNTRMQMISASALFIGLWTTFEHLFSGSRNQDKLEWRKQVPAYVAIQHIRFSIRNLSMTLRYFKQWDLPGNDTAELQAIRSSKINNRKLAYRLELAYRIHSKMNESHSLLANDGFLEHKLSLVGRLHPMSTCAPQHKEEHTLLKECEQLETISISDLILLNDARNQLVHERDTEISDTTLRIMIAKLMHYMTVIIDHFLDTFSARKDAKPDQIHRNVFGVYKELRKRCDGYGVLPTDPLILLTPHQLTKKKARRE